MLLRKKSWFTFSAHLALITYIVTSILAPVAQAGEKVFFYHTDPVGTPLAMTDSTGQKVWQAEYMPFGEEHSSVGSHSNDRTFVGKEKDVETGLHYFGARYHDSKIGRFISPDPVGAVDPFSSSTNTALLSNPQRLNYYAYSLNNPYRYVDRDGEFAQVAQGALIGTALCGPACGFAGGVVGLGLGLYAGYEISKMYNENTNEESSENNEDPKAKDAPGQTAAGQATDKYGNKIGPSGKAQIDTVTHPTRKRAKDAARNESKRALVNHKNPSKGKRHFHPSGETGEKPPVSTHHEY